MQELNFLNDKVDKLLKKYADLQAENKRLKEAIVAKEELLEVMQGKMNLLEQNMMAAGIGSSAQGDKEIVRKQLDVMIGEIDKILATLND